MFIKPFQKHNRTTNERYTVYRLCESYRIDGYIRHHNIIGLGRLDELKTDDEKKFLGKRIEEMIKYGPSLFTNESPNKQIEAMSLHFYQAIKEKRRYDVKKNGAEWETVNLATIKNKDAKEIGAEWLCKQAIDQLGIVQFLRQQHWSEESIALALTHLIGRAVYPASELKTVSFIKDNSAICQTNLQPTWL